MVRVLIIIAIIGGIASGVLGFLNNNNKKDALAAQVAAEQKAKDTQSGLDKATATLKTAQTDLADTKKKLADTSSQVQSVQAQLTAAQSSADDLKGKVAAAEQKANEASAGLEAAKKDAGEKSDAAQQAQAKADQLDKEKRGLQDQLAAANKQVADLKDQMERSKVGTTPPGVNGKIVTVNRNWNFVVLNIGSSDGLVEKSELIVARNHQVIGRVRVVSTEANTAVADILVNTLQGQIQPGDDVQN